MANGFKLIQYVLLSVGLPALKRSISVVSFSFIPGSLSVFFSASAFFSLSDSWYKCFHF